ncbi:sulfite exporter TauE/SafE family protein [Chenggangzhangella methanolivorans]|nr:sulfite exporter TauE/SafE family protein [Chenggangzhangella methanolivorans]
MSLALFMFLTFVLAGVVKGVTGMGLPTVAMGLLATVAAPGEAAALMLVPSLVTNVWQLSAGPDPAGAMQRFWPMMAAVAIATVITAGTLSGDNARYAVVGLGAILTLYAAFGLSGKRLSLGASAERWAGPPVGFVTGVVTGATGVSVMPSAPFLQALGLDKDDLVQALGLSFTVSTTALAVGLMAHGALDAHMALGSVAALAPAGLGMWLGQRLRAVISPTTFRTVFFVGMLALGLYLMAEQAA